MKPIISPSILSADFAYLAKDIEMINRSEADWVHIDIMDGVFVPNISFGFPVLKYVAKLTSKPLDVHLMIVNPVRSISSRSSFTFSTECSINFCPPNPGFTLITSTIYTFRIISCNRVIGVAGLIVTAGCIPASRICCTTRCK